MAKWLGRRTCNLEAPGSSPALTSWICFTVAPFSIPRPRFVNSQLVCLPAIGIFNMLFSDFIFISLICSVPAISATVPAKYIDTK